MDGARIFNAAIAQNIDAKELTQFTDSMMFCLSKGLSAPIGSLAVGEREFIDSARRYRKMLGGGMRQAGVIAAAGIIAIEKMIDRLKDDHANAQILAKGLMPIDGIAIDPTQVQTNIVVYDVSGLGIDGERWVTELNESGVKAGTLEAGRVRMVTHRGIENHNIEYALSVAEKIAQETRKKPKDGLSN
jgi:threonine aldolase